MLAGEVMNCPEAALHLLELLGVQVEPFRQGSKCTARLGQVDGRGVDQFENLVRARVVTRHRFEVATGIGNRVRRGPRIVAVEPIERPAAAFEYRPGVAEPALLGRQPIRLVGAEPQSVELVELEAQEVQPGRAVLAVVVDLAKPAPEVPPSPGDRGDASQQLVVTAELVDESPLPVPAEQKVMSVLSVNVDEVFAEIAQQVRGHGAIVDESSRTSPLADDASHDALR